MFGSAMCNAARGDGIPVICQVTNNALRFPLKVEGAVMQLASADPFVDP
jgi:hypothetical protein